MTEQTEPTTAAETTDSTFDPGMYRQRRIAKTVPTLGWNAEASAGFPTWQARLRAAVLRLIGGLDLWDRPPLDAQILESRQMDGYRRETITFVTRPGLWAFCYLLVPDALTQPVPAVLCLPGHGRGVDSIVGIAADGSQRPLHQPAEYQNDFALQSVARGYVTFALEQISFGHRKDAQAKAADVGHESDPNHWFGSSCNRDSMAALMLGETITGWRVWDALRAVEYLRERSEVAGQPTAVMGISGGGLTALFAAALETGIAAAVVSGYLNTFADSVLAVDHCVDNYVPGLLTVCEMPDIAGLIAPRGLFVEGGSDDRIFPRATFDCAVGRVAAVYAACGVPDRFETERFDGGHVFHGVGAWAFLERQLR